MNGVGRNVEHGEGQKGNQVDRFGMELSMVGDRVAKSPLVNSVEVLMGRPMRDY